MFNVRVVFLLFFLIISRLIDFALTDCKARFDHKIDIANEQYLALLFLLLFLKWLLRTRNERMQCNRFIMGFWKEKLEITVWNYWEAAISSFLLSICNAAYWVRATTGIWHLIQCTHFILFLKFWYYIFICFEFTYFRILFPTIGGVTYLDIDKWEQMQEYLVRKMKKLIG